MLNDGVNNVPDKTFAVFFGDPKVGFPPERLPGILEKSSKKRSWFEPQMYRCLPLIIGNTYGFYIKSEFAFEVEWDGSNETDGVKFWFNQEMTEVNALFPRVESHFGMGIITIIVPFALRTPPGVNTMTINPPNVVIPNITVMTGVIETDNLRRDFTFNLKIQMPNVRVRVPAGTPLAGFIPIPRYFADEFNLELATDIFSQEVVDEEIQAQQASYTHRREVEAFSKHRVGKHYMQGRDPYGNYFKDHQKP
jgi:hypothetical protein